MAKVARNEIVKTRQPCSPSLYPPDDLIDPRDFSFRLPPGIKAKVVETDEYGAITVVEFTAEINGFFRSIEVDIRDMDKARNTLYYFARLYRTDIWEEWNRNRFTHRAIESLKAARQPPPKKPVSPNSWQYTKKQDTIFERRMNRTMAPFCILKERLRAGNKPLLRINNKYVVDRKGFLNST